MMRQQASRNPLVLPALRITGSEDLQDDMTEGSKGDDPGAEKISGKIQRKALMDCRTDLPRDRNETPAHPLRRFPV